MKKTKKIRKAKKVAKKEQKHEPIQPLGDRILIKELGENETGRKTDSGIFIPDTVKEDRDGKRGKVIAVGAGKVEDGKRVPPEVKVGDKVVFGWGDKITIEGTEYYLVREGEISAVLN